MTILRNHIAPLLIILVFIIALVAVGARSFIPSDMAAPAPIEEVSPEKQALVPVKALPVSQSFRYNGEQG